MDSYNIVGSYSSVTGNRVQKPKRDQDPFAIPMLGANKNQGDGLEFVDVLKQLAGGFIQGFTTLDVVEEEADHWLESLAQGAGTMMGFVGMIFTGGKSGAVGRGVGLGIRGIKTGVNLLGKGVAREGAEKIVAQGIKGIRHVTQPVVGKYFIQTRSVPMYAADVIMGMGKKALAGTPAEALAKRLIGKNVIIGDVAEGAVKMGLASSVSSWQGGIDQMMYSFGTGAAFGGADRGVSNMLAQLGVNSQAVRALAGMAVNGIPSTIMDQPLEIQVFDYLTGAWFGTEMPYAQRKAYEAFTGPNAIMSDGKKRLDAYLNPETLPEYVNADELYGNQAEKVRLELKHQARMWLGTAVGNAKAGYPSQMVSHAIFKERYDALFEKYKNEGRTDDNAEELALDDIRKDPTTKHLIETSEELNERITNEEFGTPDMLNYSAAMDFAQSRIKEKATERSSSDKTIDATIGTRAPEEAASINKDIEDITTRGEEELIETVNQSEQQGISLDRLIGLEKQRPQDVFETITDNDWIPFINEVGVSERIIDQIATKELLGQQLSVRENQVKERFADRIITRTNEIQASGDLDNPIKDLNKPIDLSYSNVEPRPVADDTFVPGKDDLGSQADIIAKEPIQEARDSIGGDDFNSTAIDLNSHKVNLQDARQDIDPIISQYRTAADYVGRQLTINDGLITKDNYTAHHDNLMEQFRLATNDYLTTNSKGFKTDYDLAKWFVDSYKGNSKLKDSDQVLLSQQLVQSLHKLRSNKTLNQYVVDVYGKTVKRVDSNTNSGKLISVSKAPAFHTRALQKLGKNSYSIKYATKPFAERGAEEGAYMTKGIIDDVKDPDDLLWMHHQMAKDNKIFMGHVKSNAEFVYYDGFDVDPTRLVDADNNPIGLDKYIENTIFDAGGKAALDTYTRGKQNYVDKISKQVQGENKADIERAYDQYVYNQIELFTNVLNKGVSLKDMVKKGFINDALALNKRMQLINADGYTARDRSFEGVEGVKSEAGDYGFNYVILSSANRTQIDGKTITKRAGIDDDYFYVQNKDGSINRVTSETSTDGAVTVRQDVFDAMVKDAGYDPESGVAKSVMVGDNESGLGMLASKHSMQRAGDAQDKWMKENNVHMILRDTATKQYGKRKIYDSQLKDDGTMDLYDRNTGEAISLADKANIYRMPVDTVEYNLTTKEDISHSLSEQVLPRQLMQNMNPAIIDPEIIRGVYEETYLKSMIGDESVNKQLEESKLTGPLTKEQASKLNIDKVSLENLNDIIAGRYGEEAYDVAIRHILTKRTMEDPEDYVDSADFMGEDMSGADRIILARSESGEKLSPFLLAHKNLNKYVETKIVSYYNQRITRPEMEYSLKAIGLQTDEFNRGKVNAGEFMLGKGSRNMKVKSKALGEDTTLGKLWDAYESTKSKNIDGSYNQRIKDFEDDLRMVVIRVPADSISGTRSLMFKGFYDNRGTGVALHSEDMAALGGMDLDIDSTFIYQNLGKQKYGTTNKSLHDVLLANKDQWVKEVGDVEKTRVISESKNDAGKEFMEVQDIDKADKNIGSMFDPAYLTRAGVNATNGKSAVGYAASAKKYIESWFAASPKETIYSADHLKNFERLDANGNLVNKKREVLDSILKANNIDQTKNTVELVSIKKEEALTGDNGLLAMARQAMNYAADSADLYSVMSPLKISSKLWDVVFETKIKVTDAKGNVKYLDPEITVNKKKVSLGNLRPPQYESHKRALQSTESYKRDEYGTRKTKSLYEFMYALDGKVADGASDVASMLARDLSSMKLNDPNLFDLMGMPGLEYSYGPMIDAYKKTYTAEGVRKEIGVARKGAGTQAAKNRLDILESLFLYKSRNSANAVNAIRRDIATKYNEMANTKDPDSIYKIKTEISLMVDKAKQLVSQDISDIASSAMLFSRAEKIIKGKNPEQKKKIVAAMTEIARKADEFKRTYSTIAKQAAQNQGVNKAPALDLFQTQIKNFRDSLPSAGQKDLFDMYMLGSLNFQDPTKVAREQKLYELVTSDKSRTDPNYEANLKEYQQASEELYRNNANALGSFVKAINIKNVSEYYKGYETTARYLSNVELTRNGQISKLKMQGLVSAINKSSLDRPDSVITKVDDVVVGKKDAVESTQVTKQTVAKLADPIENVKEFDDATSVIESKGVDLSKYIDIAKPVDGKIAIDPDNLRQDVALAEMVAAKTGKNVTDTTRDFIKKTLGKDDDTIKDVNDKAYLQQLADIFDPKQTFSKEELLLIKDFKDLMGYHDAHHAPGWFASHFLSYWHGTMQKNFGSTIDPKNATLYDVRNFMQTHRFGRDYIWDVMKQGKTSKFHWKNFFWFPDTIAKHTETFDYKLQTIISYKQDFEGNLTKVYGIAPTSTMSGLHTIASSVNDMTSAMHNYRDEVVLKDFKIMENLGDDAYTLFDHAVIAHELKNKVGDREVYLAEYNKSKAKYDAIKGKDYIVTIDQDGVAVNKKMNSDEVIEHIQKQLSSHLKSFYDTYVKGNMPDGTIIKMDDPDGKARSMEFINIDKTIERVWALTKQRQDADTQIIGMNTLGKIMYQRRLENIAEGLITNGDKRSKIDIMDSLNIIAEKRGVGYKDIGEISEGYFPHLNHPDKIVEEYTLKALEAEANANNITDQIERAKYIARSEQTISKSHQNYIDKQLWDSEIANMKTEADFDAFVTSIGLDSKNKNTRSRGEKTTLPGWQRDIRTMKQYEKDIVKAYYNNMFAVLGDVRIKDFNNNVKNIDPADKAKWSKFMELYLRDNLGYPSVFSEADLAALPEIKKSPYWKFTDEYVSGKLSSMSSKFGKVPGKTKQEQIYNTTQWIQNFSNLEAKYQLMTLLSRPKTFINNIVGGEPNTIINAGFRHWKGSFSLSHLRNRIDPSFNSMADVQRWAESHGATESYLANDISRINKMAPAEVKEAINRMADVIKGKPDVKDMELLEIWKKSGLSESVFDKFAFFMRASERQLRTRSFVTHYLKARETFEASGSMIDANDPLLISMAIKGVNATQFVYNNANRPAFSRTALGKVVSRFQLWAWNSTRFRAQIYNDLKQYGMQPNSEAGKRFERMMILDMMMLGLASLLPFSVFESTLPQPMGWLVNTSKWLFGDEEDREKAFMGDLPTAVAPLQMVLPPSSRLITPIIGSLFSGDWERLGSYYSWTYFPYGLLARDVTRSLERPMMSPSLMFGLPLLEMDRIATKMSKQDEVGWGPLFRKVPMEEVE